MTQVQQEIPKTIHAVALVFMPQSGFGQVVTKFATCEDLAQAVHTAQNRIRQGSRDPWPIEQLKVGEHLRGGRLLMFPEMVEQIAAVLEQEVPNLDNPDVKAEMLAREKIMRMQQEGTFGPSMPASAFQRQ